MRFDENLLRERNEWKSVSEAPDLPFQTHAEIRNAIANRSYVLEVSYVAAREFAPFVRTYPGRLVNLILAFAPVTIIVAIISFALWQGHYLLLAGVPIVLIAHVFSHPMNPLRRRMTALCYILALTLLVGLWSRNEIAIVLLGIHSSICRKPRNVCRERKSFARSSFTIRASLPKPTFEGLSEAAKC